MQWSALAAECRLRPSFSTSRIRKHLPTKTRNQTDPIRLARFLAQAKPPLKDAAAVNATRNAFLDRFVKSGLPLELGTSGMTTFHRTMQRYPKAHWIDAACVGRSGKAVSLHPELKPLLIAAKGHGVRQRCRPDNFGFPIGHATRQKKFAGLQTRNVVQAHTAGQVRQRTCAPHRYSSSSEFQLADN